ncbi:helix-turn-helix transcriptional regulator [Zavarzinella formosa]|uniref:helix-turn-helix transcriptional regulator n=1 Tax=Zavarzinella formosa TaxID=360055 RepID=UPI0002ECAC8D|nr:helix-turn-helix transcriptional regulator [Zavarzinella formosa]
MTFGQKLREMRIKAGLSQAKLSLKAGLTPNTIQSLERGKRIPTLPVMQLLSRALECSMGVWDGLEIEATANMLAGRHRKKGLNPHECPAPDTHAAA